MKFRQDTLGVRIVLKPDTLKKMSEGGIDLSAVSTRTQAINTNKGEILMIGEATWFDKPVKPNLKPGDKIFYAKYGAMTIQDPNDPDTVYVIITDEDVLAGYTDE